MGRAIKSAKVQQMLGNPSRFSNAELRARIEAEQRISGRCDDILEPPKHLRKAVKNLWRSLVDNIIETEILTNVDAEGLEVYCNAVIEYRALQKIINRDGNIVEGEDGKLYTHPAFPMIVKLTEVIKKYANEYGFTPASRAKIAISKSREEVKDDFEKQFG
jgi:P27 family predicted phage terminase small subunit